MTVLEPAAAEFAAATANPPYLFDLGQDAKPAGARARTTPWREHGHRADAAGQGAR